MIELYCAECKRLVEFHEAILMDRSGVYRVYRHRTEHHDVMEDKGLIDLAIGARMSKGAFV